MAEPSEPKSKDGWRPNGSDWVTIIALVLAVVLSIHPPGWQIGAPVVALTVIVILVAAARSQFHPLLRTIIAVVLSVYLVWETAPSILDSFHIDYPNIAFQWPVTFGPSRPSFPRKMRAVIPNVTDGYLNLRSGPGDAHSILSRIPSGTKGLSQTGPCVPADDQAKYPFCPIEWNGQRGWVSSGGLE